MPAELSLACPAKVNLSLRVHGRRPDGFHEISTVLQTIDLCDRLVIHRVAPASPLRIEVPGGGAPADDTNLVLKAARAFFGVLGEPAAGVRFRLEKRIPAGSGLGGGSSDAAAALLGLQALWGRPLDARQLHGTAAAVGSDVPFFLEGGTAFATGRGEQVESLDDMPPATRAGRRARGRSVDRRGLRRLEGCDGGRQQGRGGTVHPVASSLAARRCRRLGARQRPGTGGSPAPPRGRPPPPGARAGREHGRWRRRPGFGQRRRRVRGRGGTRHPGRTGRNERACVPDTNAASASSRALHVVVTFCKMGRPVWGVAKW